MIAACSQRVPARELAAHGGHGASDLPERAATTVDAGADAAGRVQAGAAGAGSQAAGGQSADIRAAEMERASLSDLDAGESPSSAGQAGVGAEAAGARGDVAAVGGVGADTPPKAATACGDDLNVQNGTVTLSWGMCDLLASHRCTTHLRPLTPSLEQGFGDESGR